VAALRAEAEERARQAELDRVRAEGDRARLEADGRTQRQKRRTQLAVALGLVGLLVVGGAAWMTVRNQAQARRTDAERLTGIALGRTMQLAIQARAIDATELPEANAALRLWEQAETNIEQAEEAVAGGGSPTLKAFVGEKAAGIRTGLAKARRDSTLLAALEAAAGSDPGTVGENPDQRESVRAFRSAFAAAGLPTGGDPATLAAAVRAEPKGLGVALLRALDRWASSLRYPPDPDVERVRTTADLVDGDPTRKEIRAAVAGGDKEILSRLAERLANVPLQPASAVMLGEALKLKGLDREAVRILRLARDRDPSDLWLLTILGWSLSSAYAGDPVVIEEGVGCARAAVAAHPNKAFAHYQLGQAFLFAKKDPASAEVHYRKTVELNPRFTFAMVNLGYVRQVMGDLAGAEQWYRKAAVTDPQLPMAHHLLGETLKSKGDLAGAEAEYRVLIALDPNNKSDRENLAQVQRMASLLARLDDELAGRTAPATPAEAVEFALLCRQPFRGQHAAAVRLFDRAFAEDPKLADDLASANRYDAACSAALAGSGQGTDAPTDPAGRAALRGKALAWLRVRLAVKARQAASDNPADRKRAAGGLKGWLDEGVLAAVRPDSDRCDLPADERAGWESFWSNVREALAAAQKPAPPVPTSTKP
jgi:tetratricopeptide (TPR) repeat protein